MIKRKAGVNVIKLSGVIRKRALFGVAVFCVAAITTVGALSTADKEEEDTPNSLVDLNETKSPEGDNSQVADNQGNTEVSGGQQVADNQGTGDIQQPEQNVADQTGNQDEQQVADRPEENGKGDEDDFQQVADKEPEVTKPDPIQTADKEPEEPQQPTEVLSPQLIAEQLNFDKSAGLLWPLQGSIIIPYSPDHGVYFSTLDQFRTSEAVVLSAKVGTEVKAAAKGVVTSIEEDVRTGTTVTLALGNNTTLVYGQLELTDLEEGDVLEAGECLGTVAEPTRYYVVEGPNLYFQVIEGEASIDPTLLLGEK